MTFLYPLGAAFLATLPVILGLYILRLKRRQVTVSSNIFWRQVLEDVEANTPFQRLRYSHLLLVQLLIAALIVLSLMNPAITYSATRGLDTVFIVDTSASMATVEANTSRIQAARTQILELIAAKGRSDRIGIIAAGRSPQVLASLTADASLLRGAVEQLRIEPAVAALPPSADLALQLLAEAQGRDRQAAQGAAPPPTDAAAPDGQVVLFTDDPASFGTPPDTAQNVRWSVQPLGFLNTANAGILAADFTNPNASEGTMTLFLTTSYIGQVPATAELKVTHAGKLLDLRTLTLQPGVEESHLFDGVPLETGRYELELTLKGAAEGGASIVDALDLDNRAYLVYEDQSRFRVLTLSNNAIYGLVLSRLDNVQVFQRALSGGVPDTGYDLVVVDGDLPLNAPPGNYLVIHSNNHDLLPVNVVGEETLPVVTEWKATDPLMRFVNPQAFQISRMMKVEPKDWGRVVLDTNKGPAIVYGEQGQQRVVYWAFDPFGGAGDLPRRSTFPIMLSSLVDYFSSRRGEHTISTSDLLRFSTPASEVEVRRPDGTASRVTTQPGEDLGLPPDQLGFWSLAATSGEQQFTREFGVNLFAASESLLPAGETYDGTTGLAAFEQSKQGTHSQWRWVALAVLIFLLVEWWIYHQRIF